MLGGHDIVCLSADWDQDPLSKHHIMRRLARHNRVLWVNSIGMRNPTISGSDAARAWRKLDAFFRRRLREAAPNLQVLSPIVWPFHGSIMGDAVNKRLLAHQVRWAMRSLGMRDPVLWTFLPNGEMLSGLLGERLLVYHITDDFTQFSGHPAREIDRMERRLIAKADVVIASSGHLAEIKAYGGMHIQVVGHGVEHAHFARALTISVDQLPADIKDAKRPVIGFYGELNDWIDTRMLAELARTRPQWTLALIGRIAVEAGDISYLLDLPNVRWLGQKKFGELPGYCAAFDVALIPMKMNELTKSVNPLKLREYLAAGVPVISAPLPEVLSYGDAVAFAQTAPEYVAAIERSLEVGKGQAAAKLSQRVAGESWDSKVAEIEQLIEEALQRTQRTAS
jgi:glycosyltransferase involved in cell wall biosynthesis